MLNHYNQIMWGRQAPKEKPRKDGNPTGANKKPAVARILPENQILNDSPNKGKWNHGLPALWK